MWQSKKLNSHPTGFSQTQIISNDNKQSGMLGEFNSKQANMSDNQINHLSAPTNQGPSPLFGTLCEHLFDTLLNITKIKKYQSRKKPYELRTLVLENFIKRWRENVGNDIFPVFRLCEYLQWTSLFSDCCWPSFSNARCMFVKSLLLARF